MFDEKKHLTSADFKAMYELEKCFYDEAFITPYEESEKWYKAHPHSICVLSHEDKLIGFMNLFPIEKNLYDLICSGQYNDALLTDKDILPLEAMKNGGYLFLSCVAIAPAYRKTDALKTLVRRYVTRYQNVEVFGIVTDNVTAAGERFSQRMGFKCVGPTDHHSVIYEGRLDDLRTFVHQEAAKLKCETTGKTLFVLPEVI